MMETSTNNFKKTGIVLVILGIMILGSSGSNSETITDPSYVLVLKRLNNLGGMCKKYSQMQGCPQLANKYKQFYCLRGSNVSTSLQMGCKAYKDSSLSDFEKE